MFRNILQGCRLNLTIAMLIGLAVVQSACTTNLANKEMVDDSAEATQTAQADTLRASADVYIVATGDSLWSISGSPSIYNDPFRWPLIYSRNTEIEDADLIYPNQQLLVPRDLTREDINKAITHAKSRGAWSIGEVEQSDVEYRASAM